MGSESFTFKFRYSFIRQGT